MLPLSINNSYKSLPCPAGWKVSDPETRAMGIYYTEHDYVARARQSWRITIEVAMMTLSPATGTASVSDVPIYMHDGNIIVPP
jgi:hypothetical protein